jgi:hypothetical protein
MGAPRGEEESWGRNGGGVDGGMFVFDVLRKLFSNTNPNVHVQTNRLREFVL